MNIEPTRQIHLDFHTSEHLPDIGAEFSKKQFQEALIAGKVNLINIFAKCHHSWSYYPTAVGRPHPNLAISDLLGEQIEACHEIGVKAPIYYTVGWSANDAEDHPEWVMRLENGEFAACETPWDSSAGPDDPKPTFQWKEMCVTGEYHELMMAQTEEICRMYDVDGMWYDIYHPQQPCYCDRCRKGMRDQGYDANDPLQAGEYRAKTILSHTSELKRMMESYHADASIYFNGLTAINRPQNFKYRLFQNNSKNDLEDLPTTWGGYDKLPLRAKIFQKENKPVVAMSGKFHTAWGEFGGFKDAQALRYEAAGMIAYGASCNFGDHLHPSGKMDMTTYRNIGHAYDYVEKIEEYGIGGKTIANLGIWASYQLAADEGLCRMLMEEQLDFDVVGPEDDLSTFQTIVVPSHPGLLVGAEKKLRDYMETGGSLVVLAEGILDNDSTKEIFECGGRYLGKSLYDMDYTVVSPRLHQDDCETEDIGKPEGDSTRRGARLPESPFLNYESALRFDVDEGCEILANIQEPHFNRTYGHYCGHQNTPNKRENADYPSSWRRGNVIVIAHSIDRMYYDTGAKVHRDYFIRILRLLHSEPMVEAGLPSAGRVSLLHQDEKSRYVAHILYGSPMERGRCLVIEDLPELRDIVLRFRIPKDAKSIVLQPQGTPLAYTKAGSANSGRNIIETRIPAFSAHCAVVVEY